MELRSLVRALGGVTLMELRSIVRALGGVRRLEGTSATWEL